MSGVSANCERSLGGELDWFSPLFRIVEMFTGVFGSVPSIDRYTVSGR